jgi:uncharacterized membrane protein YgcG
VQDLAELITPDDEVLIDEWCEAVQTEHTVPVVVVTIESMARHGGEGLLVETFARSLFEQWGNDPAFALAEDWRRGILLLISKNDRKARIELGGSWSPDYVARCVRIMNSVIVPSFKAGQYSRGTVGGVQAIVDMVRVEPAIAAPAETSNIDAATASGSEAPPVRAVETAPPIRPVPVRQVSYPSHRVQYPQPSTGVSPAFGLVGFAMAGIFFLSLIGKALGVSSASSGGIHNYRARRHHHHHHHGGIGSGFHHGGHHFGGHRHGGGFSGGSSHGGGGSRGGGGRHGGGGGATGSW